MTPKDKAQELIKVFSDKLFKDTGIGSEDKSFAYLCTEQIIMALYDQGIKEPEYWYNVQSEIENL